jgi:hypothetical protein
MIDYCRKRGFRESVQALFNETKIPPDEATPPINAPQGLLFELVRDVRIHLIRADVCFLQMVGGILGHLPSSETDDLGHTRWVRRCACLLVPPSEERGATATAAAVSGADAY